MLDFIKKITITIALLFTINVANAEIGFVNALFRGTENCSNKVEQITFKGEKTDIVTISLTDERGRIILNEKVSISSISINLKLPCGYYNLAIANIKKGIVKNYPIQLR